MYIGYCSNVRVTIHNCTLVYIQVFEVGIIKGLRIISNGSSKGMDGKRANFPDTDVLLSLDVVDYVPCRSLYGRLHASRAIIFTRFREGISSRIIMFRVIYSSLIAIY